MNISKTNNLSFYNEQGILTLNAKQFDTGRKFVFHIMDSDEPFDLPENCTAYLRIAKADGTQFQGHECCKIDGSKITIDPSVGNGSQIFAAAGTNVCELHLEDADGISLTTWNFNIYVEPRVHDGSHVASIDSYDVIDVAIAMEKERVKNEQIRINNEAKRIEDEKQRILEESKRLENETERQNTFGTVLNKAELYVTTASVCAYNAKKSEINSAKCEENAFNHATEAESYAHGATGVRDGEDTDNAKYYKEQAQKVFENLQRSTVTGVKGDAESEYRIGNVNITPENVGALSLKKGGTVNNTFQVNKASSTSPTGLIELDIRNDGKVAINTFENGNGTNQESLAHFSGDVNYGVIQLHGSSLGLYQPNILLDSDNGNEIRITHGLQIFKPGTNDNTVRQIVIDSENKLAINNKNGEGDTLYSLAHFKGDYQNGIIDFRGEKINIYAPTIAMNNQSENKLICGATCTILGQDDGIHICHKANMAGVWVTESGVIINSIYDDTPLRDNYDNPRFVCASFNQATEKVDIYTPEILIGPSNDPFIEAKRNLSTTCSKSLKLRGGTNASILIDTNNNIEFGSDGGKFIFKKFPGDSNVLCSIDKDGRMSINELTGKNTNLLKITSGASFSTGEYNSITAERYYEGENDDYVGDILDIRSKSIISSNYDSYIELQGRGEYTDRDGYLAETNGYTIIKSDAIYLIADAFNILFGTYGYRFSSSYFYPRKDNVSFLGHPSYKWSGIFATNGTIQTSDRNAKNTIEELSREQAQKLIYGLKPSTYKMNSGTSDRTHWGMISQDIEELLEQLGWTSLDFAGFIKSPKMHIEEEERDPETGKVMKERMEEIIEGEYDYSLRYDEFIAPMIKVIQSQHEEIQNQNKRIETLEKRLELLEQKLLLE